MAMCFQEKRIQAMKLSTRIPLHTMPMVYSSTSPCKQSLLLQRTSQSHCWAFAAAIDTNCEAMFFNVQYDRPRKLTPPSEKKYVTSSDPHLDIILA